MGVSSRMSRLGALIVLGIASAEVVIMISPFAGLFYTSFRYDSFLGFFSKYPLTAWLDGFFLNHSVVTESPLLEWQRKAGRIMFALGLWGFFVSAFQVYYNKLFRRGVAKGLLYRYVRHPQYLCLGIAGWGILTIWPRFLLLLIWITMLFLYAALANFEESRMKERFGGNYADYAENLGFFLPKSPVRRMYRSTFGKIRPGALGLMAAYVSALIVAASIGFGLRAYTQASSAVLFVREHNMVLISAWPQPEDWMKGIYSAALLDKDAEKKLQNAAEKNPIVVTILPPGYIMKSMYYKKSYADGRAKTTMEGFSFARLGRISLNFLLPVKGILPRNFMGIDPDSTDKPVQVVFSGAVKAYKERIALEEALDAGVLTTPIVVIDITPDTHEITGSFVPIEQNIWGPNVVMPLF